MCDMAWHIPTGWIRGGKQGVSDVFVIVAMIVS